MKQINDAIKAFELRFARAQFGTRTRLKLYRKLYSFIKDGISLYEVLKKLQGLYAKKKGDPRAVAIQEWLTRMEQGRSFASALQGWAPSSEIMLIESGEQSGDLAGALLNTVEVTESVNLMKKTIKGGLAYPTALFAALMGMIYMFAVKVIPEISSIQDPALWPDVSQTLYHFSLAVQNYWWAFLLAFLCMVVAIVYSLPRLTGPVRHILDRVPPWSIYRTIQSSVFLVAVSALMKTGTPLMESIMRLRTLSAPYTRFHMSLIIRRMKAGFKDGLAMNTGHFLDTEVGNDIEIYGELTDFQVAMESLGRDVITRAVEQIKASTQVMANLVLLAMGVYIGWTYYAFMTLTSSIAQNAQGF